MVESESLLILDIQLGLNFVIDKIMNMKLYHFRKEIRESTIPMFFSLLDLYNISLMVTSYHTEKNALDR